MVMLCGCRVATERAGHGRLGRDVDQWPGGPGAGRLRQLPHSEHQPAAAGGRHRPVTLSSQTHWSDATTIYARTVCNATALDTVMNSTSCRPNGTNRTVPPCGVGRRTGHAPGPAAADRPRVLQTTTPTEDSVQNNTGPLGGPVISKMSTVAV